MNIDIVTELRREAYYQPTSRLDQFGWPQIGFELTRTNLLAADEIERLRNELTERIHMCDMRSEKIIELTDERDEVRQSYCLLMEAYRGGDGKVTANKLGWGYLFAEDSK
jgi:hypothetical protein